MPDKPARSRTYTYGQVVTALARLHSVDETNAGSFEARIRHFQRLGVVPASPGKGKRIQYDFAAAFIWAFCLELAEFSVAPEIIKLIVQTWGPSLVAIPPPGDAGDIIFWFAPNLLTSGPEKLRDELKQRSGFAPAADLILDLSGRLWPSDPSHKLLYRGRLLTINASHLQDILEQALAGCRDLLPRAI